MKMLIMKRHKTEGIELPNQEKIKTIREKYTLGILKADTIKHVEIKEKIIRSISREWESYLRQNYIGRTL